MIDPDDDDDDNHAAADPGTQTSLALVDVISSIPIDRAIFTSYTLSLAWFEGHLLRSLERCGANRIVLLADPAGVDSSLQEGLVSGVGVRYAVEPVTAPNGAFQYHPLRWWSPGPR